MSCGGRCHRSRLHANPSAPRIGAPEQMLLHIPFENDADTIPEYGNLLELVNDQMNTGRTCIVADSRYTDRWKDVRPTECRGDLAFFCNNPEVTKELVQWADSRDNRHPRCTGPIPGQVSHVSGSGRLELSLIHI